MAAATTEDHGVGEPSERLTPWVVDVEVQVRHGYAGDLAARSRWRNLHPREAMRLVFDDTYRIRVHVTAITRAEATMLARAKVLEVFSPKHYSLATVDAARGPAA